MKPQSAKQKGRKLQQWVVDKLVKILKAHPEDLESRPMGSNGEDIIMARAARQLFPYSIECKNQERVNIWNSYEQAKSNCGKYEPLLIIKKNNTKPLAVVDAEYFIKSHK